MGNLKKFQFSFLETLLIRVFLVFLLFSCDENLISPGLGEGVDYLPPAITIQLPNEDGLAFKTNNPLQPVLLSGTWSDNQANKGASIVVRWMEQNQEFSLGNFTGPSWSVNLNTAFGAAFASAAGAQNFRVIVTDAAGNKNHASRFLLADNNSLSVVEVTSLADNGWYRAGQTLPLRVIFTKQATVTGTPRLKLNSGPSVYAQYVSGSGTNVLVFHYLIQTGENAPESAELDYDSTTALELNGGTIKDNTGTDAVLSLGSPGLGGSLGANKNFYVDTVPPSVNNVHSSTANGSYSTGSALSIQVQFNEPVLVTGVPRLELNIAGKFATYTHGSGSSTLNFLYTVAAGDASPDLDYASTTALDLNGGTIRDPAGNDAVLTLANPGAPNSLGHNKAIVVDAVPPVAPTITGVVSGNYNTPQSFTLTGIEPGASAFYTLDGGSTWNAYSVMVNLITNGTYIIQSRQTDVAGNTSSVSASVTVVIDGLAFVVSNVDSLTASGSYKAGQNVDITVQFTKSAFVTGTPTLALNTGGSASYLSGSGSNILVFRYTVASGHNTADLDYTSTTALSLSGGSIKDSLGLNATLTLPAVASTGSLGYNKNIVIDTVAPTVISVSSSTTPGHYNENKNIGITVTFSEPVVVSGSPVLRMNTSASVRNATYAFGSGTNVLTFTYLVQAGDNANPLNVHSATALTGTITDLATNTANLNQPTSGPSSLPGVVTLVVDTTPPSAPTVSGISGGNFNTVQTFTVSGELGASLEYTVNGGTTWQPYTGPVTLNTDGAYAVRARQTDQAGNLGSASSAVNLNLDLTAPVVTNVTSSTVNGIHTHGSTIVILVQFSENVTVTGAPKLNLNTSPARSANYQSGSGTSSLTFHYVVQVNDASADLDYANTGALDLNGGTIRDAFSNNANLTLANPGSPQSLGYNKNLVIDAVAPTLISTNPTHNQLNVTSSSVNLTFSEPVFKGTGKITFHRVHQRFPVLMSQVQRDEYRGQLSGANLTTFDNSFSYTTNGAVAGVPNTQGLWVLNYNLDPDNASLLTIFDALGYNKIEVDVQSAQVTGAGSATITITPSAGIPPGVLWYVLIDGTAFKDAAGYNYAGIASSAVYRFTTGPVATPVIRIRKQSGSENSQPTTTTLKISSETEGATIRYTSSNSGKTTVNNPALPADPGTPTGASTPYSTEITIGTVDLDGGYIYRIKARAFKSGLSDSAVAEEVAFKTVFSSNFSAFPTGFNSLWYRGGDAPAGPPVAPGFPLTWDQTQYGFVKLAKNDSNNWRWVTWAITVPARYKALIGDKPADWATNGPQQWRWQLFETLEIQPGGYRHHASPSFESGTYTR